MSKPVGRNNSKIITRNQGGGNKKLLVNKIENI